MDNPNFSIIAPAALAQMLQNQLAERQINIGLEIEGQNTMSIVTLDEYHTDQEFSLRYYRDF